MARTAGTTERAGAAEVAAASENAKVEKVNENGLTKKEQDELDAQEEARKEDAKVAKAAVTRLTNAVEAAREKGWTVSCRIDRLDVDGTSEGHTL